MATEKYFYITLDIDGQSIKAVYDYDTLYSGIVGVLRLKVNITDWKEEDTVIRFTHGDNEPIDIIWDGDYVDVPPNVITAPGFNIAVGGYKHDGENLLRFIPTNSVFIPVKKNGYGSRDAGLGEIEDPVSLEGQLIAIAKAGADNANAAADNAEEKANLANTAAENADGKAILAEEKAVLAEEKAALADAAAENANTAAENANEKAELVADAVAAAEEAAENAQTAADNANSLIERLGSVYKVCGSAEPNALSSSTAKTGDVYNIKIPDGDDPSVKEIYNGGNVSVPVAELYPQNKCVVVAHSEYDEYFLHLADGKDAYNKGLVVLSIDSSNPLMGVYKVEDEGETLGIAIYWTSDNVYWEDANIPEDGGVYDMGITVNLVEWGLPVNDGDNVVWTGYCWDKLAGTVDLSGYAEKEAVEQKADKATTLAGYGIEDAYTKEEIDSKVSGVYRFCGSTTVNQNMYNITATPQGAGDVYNIATGGTISSGATVSIPFEIPYPEDNLFYMYTANAEDNNTLAVVAADPNNTVFIGPKGTGYQGRQATIRITKVDYASEYGLDLYFEYIEPPADGVLDSENWEITAVEYQFDVKSGDNVVWNGKIWDILAGTVDLSGYATKDDIGDIETALDSIIAIQNELIGGDSV